jgi:hypothetical protein
MAIRIVHFGEDVFDRIAALKSKGYSVEECYSLSELHASLVGLVPADAVTIAYNDGAVTDHAISLTRSISAVPLILFRDENDGYNRPEIDLVIPTSARLDEDSWLNDIAELICRNSQRNC